MVSPLGINMSYNAKDIQYTCPYCNKEFTTVIYDNVNVKDDSDMRDMVVSGDTFRHVCPHCHTHFMIQNPMVYSDPDHKFVLWLSTEEPNKEIHELSQPLLEKDFTLRRCASIQELVEKIEIFEDGLDDVAIELAKYDAFIDYYTRYENENPVVTSVEYQNTQNGTCKINVRAEDKGLSFFIPYDALEEEIRAESERFEIDNKEFPLINREWMISIFEEPEGIA